ncbi:MAG TPA: winged helix DNA-binding domain-containing protein [Streptosporangiaceae bacterium]
MITGDELNRATLARQLLLRREALPVTEAVRRLVALQAQEPASPYLALWNRLTDFDLAGLDAALAERAVVKGTLLRVTLHAVHAGDYAVFREAMEPTLRASRLGDPRFRASGLTAADADALVSELLVQAGQPRTSAELAAWLEARLGTPLDPAAWRMLRQYAPLLHTPGSGPWSFAGHKHTFVAPAGDCRPALDRQDAAAIALPVLIQRYLAAYGPASVADMAQFAMVQRARAKTAVQTLGDALDRIDGPDGAVLYDVPGAPRPAGDTPAPPRLLGMWDSVLLAYHDRSRVIPPGLRKHVIRINGDVLPVLLVDGYVAGVWRMTGGQVEATAFQPLAEQAWDGLAAEAGPLLALTADRDPALYSRFGHWWKKLPDGERRLLPGSTARTDEFRTEGPSVG